MKTSNTSIKNKLVTLTAVGVALFSTSIMAKPVALVKSITGSAFVITPEGTTRSLKAKEVLNEKSEVMVDEGATVTLNDYYDATYNLVGGTHVKIFNQSMQLKRGKMWTGSVSDKHNLSITTANGLASFSKADFVSIFDASTSRSQFLVVNGSVDVSNVLDENMRTTVSNGAFTFVDPAVEDGVPRAPTKIGAESLAKTLAEFKGLTASAIPEVQVAKVEAPEPARIEERRPASVDESAYSYFTKKVSPPLKVSAKPAPKLPAVKLSDAPIRFYGFKTSPVVTTKPRVEVRTPASVQVKNVGTAGRDHAFEQSLKMKVQEQPNHPKELNSLIEELKSY